MKSFVFVLGVLIAQLAIAEELVGEARKSSVDFIYTIKRGDSLGALSKELLDTPARWKDVAAYNHLSDANRIEPGQTLNIQLPWMKLQPVKARIEAVTGVASANGREVKAGDEVAMGDNLQTPQGAAVRMRLPDGSVVNLMENSQLGIEKLEKNPGNIFAAFLRLVSGQLEAFKAKYPAGQSDLKIQSRSATLGVRGTHFRMRQQDNISYAEIESGLVSFDAEKTPQVLALAGGEGAVADGVHAAVVIPLLLAPTFPVLPAVFEHSTVEWIMPEMTGAEVYVGELAQDEEFTKELVSVRADGHAIVFKNLQDGQYWLRLRAVDSHGLQGREGKTFFSVRKPILKPVTNKVPATDKVSATNKALATIKAYVTGKTVEILWPGSKGNEHYQVQIAHDQEFTKLMLDKQTQDSWVDLPRPEAGHYYMRVRNILSAGRMEEWTVPVIFETP